MKPVILFLLSCSLSFFAKAQTSIVVANWSAAGHISYEVQRSYNNTSWFVVATFKGGVNDSTYTYTIPYNWAATYYRIKADTSITKSIYLPK